LSETWQPDQNMTRISTKKIENKQTTMALEVHHSCLVIIAALRIFSYRFPPNLVYKKGQSDWGDWSAKGPASRHSTSTT